MVWGLFPVASDAQRFYIFSKGTYKVGRKDCDVIIQTDRAISRVHAEIIVNSMASRDPSHNGSVSFLCDVCIRDLSKFGTYINKELGSNPVYSCPNKKASLKDGDLVSFGTGNAIYRFCFVTVIVFIHSLKPFEADPSFQDTISSIGAYSTHRWSSECTHVVSDEFSTVTEDLIEAIVAQKPIVLSTWFKILAEKNIEQEMPSCSPYAPTMTLEGTFVKIVEPKVRENCLKGYTFVLGSSQLYIFGAKLPALLQVVGALVLSADEFSSRDQTSGDGGNNQLVLVIPARSVNEFSRFNHLTTLPKVRDAMLVAAVLSGHLEPSFVQPPSIHISSSHSTDETIVEESDVEINTVISSLVGGDVKLENSIEIEENIAVCKDKEMDGDQIAISSEKVNFSIPKYVDGGIIERKEKGNDSEASGYQNADIIFSQDLIVRNTSVPTSLRSTSKTNVVNFKCFRKRETLSGNSFKDLIPFAKDPYRDSDYGNNGTAEYIRAEKKRKQMEAVAEDLFNNEKANKRGIARSTTLDAFLAHC